MTRTIALVTLYNPTESVVSNMKNIAKQVDKVYLCDNSENDNSGMFCAIDNLKYIAFHKNLGISVAFNMVLKNHNLKWKKDDFIIFFDQDSKVTDTHIKRLEREFSLVENRGIKIGCLGPVYYNRSSGFVEIAHKRKQVTEHVFCVKDIITSSMLTTYENIESVGYFSEEIFLDYADWDLCWKFNKDKKICCLTNAVILDHAVGEGDKHVGPLRIRRYPPQREYYQIRDSLYLFKKKYTPFKNKIGFAIRITLGAFVHCVFLDNRKERIMCVLKGYKDYRNKIIGVLD